MDTTHHPIHTSPISPIPLIPCNGRRPCLVFRNLLAHKLMEPLNQTQLCLWSKSEGPKFQPGFNIVIVFLAVMGKIFQHSQTNFVHKAIELLTSSLALGCQSKIFQIGLRSVKGTADLIIQYAEEDMAFVREGNFTMGLEPGPDNLGFEWIFCNMYHPGLYLCTLTRTTN